MKQKFFETPKSFIDQHTINRVKKSEVTIYTLRNNLTDSSDIKLLDEISTWINNF